MDFIHNHIGILACTFPIGKTQYKATVLLMKRVPAMWPMYDKEQGLVHAIDQTESETVAALQ